MRARLRSRKLTWCLAISLGAMLAFTSPVQAADWQDWGNGWLYYYSSATNTGYWRLNGRDRLAYQNASGQWWDCDKFGAWRTLGTSGVTDTWIGDGGWHNLRNGWSYLFASSLDQSYWTDSSLLRLSYQYGNGQWWDYGTNWYKIGAINVSASFLGDGGWHGLNNGWAYLYASSIDQSYWTDNGLLRLSYRYGNKQWLDYGTNWYTIGAPNAASAFVGDGGWHSLNNGWSYLYSSSIDQAYWTYGGLMKYSYRYAGGQWWDYTANGWGRLGVGSLASSQFIGDGAWHQFSTGDYFHGDGNVYYWYSGGVDQYKYAFASGSWSYWSGSAWSSLTYGGDWQNPDCRYLYNATFVESGLAYDTGISAPAGRRELVYDVYNYSTGTYTFLTEWKIHNPGTDNRWSGADLNVAWGNTRHYDTEIGSPTYHTYIDDFNQAFGEFTKEDVVFFAADFEQNPIGFHTMVDWMTFVRDYFGKQVRTVQVMAHGNDEAWQMGQYMSLNNYTSFEADWRRWGTLMTTDAQIISIHCQSGMATAMLNAIASWSGCDIYANTNTTYTMNYRRDTNYDWRDPNVWNLNYGRMDWYDSGTYNSSDPASTRWFEYTTTGLQDYRWLFTP